MINKYTPKRKDKLVDIRDIKEDLVLIEGTLDYYITKSGEVYRHYYDDLYYKRRHYNNEKNGYVYITINDINGNKRTKRLHRLVAKAFLPNPKNLEIVGHKDNNKKNNNVDNLYWTTSSENTQKAVDDGLLVNDKGFQDSQSMPVVVSTKSGTLVGEFGSVSEAHRGLKISKSTILRQCNGEVDITKVRCGYVCKYLNKSSLQTIERVCGKKDTTE